MNPGVGVAAAAPKPMDGADVPMPLPLPLLLPKLMAGVDDPVDPEPNPPNPPNPLFVVAAFIAPVAAGMVGDIIELDALLGEAPNPPKPVPLVFVAPAPLPLPLPNANGDAVDVVEGADPPNPPPGAVLELPNENEGTALAGCEDASLDAADPPRVKPPLG